MRRKKSEMPFAEALDFARKRLAKATKEREAAAKSLSALDSEIPSLQATIAVLEQQLGMSKAGPKQESYDITKNVTTDFGSLEIHELTEQELLPEPEGRELLPDE